MLELEAMTDLECWEDLVEDAFECWLEGGLDTSALAEAPDSWEGLEVSESEGGPDAAESGASSGARALEEMCAAAPSMAEAFQRFASLGDSEQPQEGQPIFSPSPMQADRASPAPEDYVEGPMLLRCDETLDEPAPSSPSVRTGPSPTPTEVMAPKILKRQPRAELGYNSKNRRALAARGADLFDDLKAGNEAPPGSLASTDLPAGFLTRAQGRGGPQRARDQAADKVRVTLAQRSTPRSGATLATGV